MAEPTQYYQCRLERRPDPATVLTTIGWIEARAAKRGVEVELLPSNQLWEVAEVFGVDLTRDQVKAMEANYRAGMPSTRDTGTTVQ